VNIRSAPIRALVKPGGSAGLQRGAVDLKTFECRDIDRSSFIQRVCYDKAQSYMLISLNGTYYHYCELPHTTFDGLMGAPSPGAFFQSKYQGHGFGWSV
jgi:hypothetical protein